MGCDIHSYAETRSDDGTWELVPWTHGEYPDEGPFGLRVYGVFGFLADVRNYSAVPVVVEPRGIPYSVSPDVRDEFVEFDDYHSVSWLSVDELLAFDYDATFEDRRVTRGSDGGRTADPGGGTVVTFREFLGVAFMRDLDELRKLNEQRPTRVVFWFDN